MVLLPTNSNGLLYPERRINSGVYMAKLTFRVIHPYIIGSVGALEPEQDPHAFGPPGSGTFSFLINVLSGLQNNILIFNTKF
jgi:hypothetical protein